MAKEHHLLLSAPDNWTTDQRGVFFESFVADILRPMRFEVISRIRVTGMEIDLLARGIDQPRTVLVECKAQRDPIPADVISKLIGNVTIRGADAGWLFSTSDLTKDGRGQWEAIQSSNDLAPRFSWYSPATLCDILIDQRLVSEPFTLVTPLQGFEIGDFTLIIEPSRRAWLLEILQEGIPAYFVVFDAKSGQPLDASAAIDVAHRTPRFSSLTHLPISSSTVSQPPALPRRAPVARVVSGDTWDDLRPARPVDFVGRDDVIAGISEFIAQVRDGQTSTRTFAIQGPSGWGKSSLVLKLADLAKRGSITSCSLTAVDSRSATNSAFVTEAVRQAFVDAIEAGVLPKQKDLRLGSLQYPLDSDDLREPMSHLFATGRIIVLIFDQFEELFAKEALFETFNAVRELSLDLDARQIPMVLGFAWKTDIALPQQHPAYHLWHQLSDRRRTFAVRAFGRPDILKVISKAEKASQKQLSAPLRDRLVEQCQGLPWLLKKLVVHILTRLSTAESQYDLLERKLDVEMLFKDDLATLNAEQLQCLKYVATNSPVSVADVEAAFSSATTNILIDFRLLVRSGMNYVVYWDIFRDYLIDGVSAQ